MDAVILDQEHFIQTEGWSMVQSLKMIRSNLCVVLVVHGKLMAFNSLNGVDAVVPDHDAQALTAALKQLLKGFESITTVGSGCDYPRPHQFITKLRPIEPAQL